MLNTNLNCKLETVKVNLSEIIECEDVERNPLYNVFNLDHYQVEVMITTNDKNYEIDCSELKHDWEGVLIYFLGPKKESINIINDANKVCRYIN